MDLYDVPIIQTTRAFAQVRAGSREAARAAVERRLATAMDVDDLVDTSWDVVGEEVGPATRCRRRKKT